MERTMGVDQVVELGRAMLTEVMLLVAPVLLVAICVSLLVNVVQVLTSLQDQTLSAVPRLAATGAALFFLMPWMWRHLANYTIHLLMNFQKVMQ
jgi:flagellar biosynthetic protein FliQ